MTSPDRVCTKELNVLFSRGLKKLDEFNGGPLNCSIRNHLFVIKVAQEIEKRKREKEKVERRRRGWDWDSDTDTSDSDTNSESESEPEEPIYHQPSSSRQSSSSQNSQFQHVKTTILNISLIFALLISLASASIDCSNGKPCYGEPTNFDLDTECSSMLYFDKDRNVLIYLRNFSDSQGYAALTVERHPDETIEYFFCLPRQEELFKGLADDEGYILHIDKNITGHVTSLGDKSEFAECFHQDFSSVSKGIYHDVVQLGTRVGLYNSDNLKNYDDEFEEVIVEPTMFYLGKPVQQRVMSTADNSKVKADGHTSTPDYWFVPDFSIGSKDGIPYEDEDSYEEIQNYQQSATQQILLMDLLQKGSTTNNSSHKSKIVESRLRNQDENGNISNDSNFDCT